MRVVRTNSAGSACTTVTEAAGPPGAATSGIEGQGMNSNIIRVEQHGDIAVVIPLRDLGEMTFAGANEEILHTLRSLEEADTVQNIVLDFENIDYFGSSAVGAFVRLWKRISARGGSFAVCHLTDHQRDVLQTNNLDSIWQVCPDRMTAMELVGGAAP